MKKKNLSNILEGKIFEIPDYQRGYAWEKEQWKDFVQDIDALFDDKMNSHYTGTIVIYQKPERPTVNYGAAQLEKVEVVDGQQRLTTLSLYLSIIMKKLASISKENFSAEVATYLHSGSKTKLKLNNDTADFYGDLVSKGVSNIEARSVHQIRINDAHSFLKKHIEDQLEIRADGGEEYLKGLVDAITQKMNFSSYEIEVESEIGMTFELMNSRGKDLSTLELLKNYLMYWVYRNIQEISQKEDITDTINKAWKEVYQNIANCKGSEKQCLRIAWTLYVSHTPKKWDEYRGFKADDVIPLRDFQHRSREEVKAFILKFVDGLALISKHYSAILKPNESSSANAEFELLTRIRNMGTSANLLPLMVAARIKHENNEVSDDEYIALLTSLERYCYRVFLWEGKRSNSGLSKFYRWANDVYSTNDPMETVQWVTQQIYGTISWFSPENNFRKALKEDFFEWYHNRRLLKYTLFEYELFLLAGKNPPKLKWEDLTDSTIEHILPQNPASGSVWKKNWKVAERNKYLHDIGNLVLTKDNSVYSNFEFERKKGISGLGNSYANSDIRQERALANFPDWTLPDLLERREVLTDWIIDTWGIDNHFQHPVVEVTDEEEELILDSAQD